MLCLCVSRVVTAATPEQIQTAIDKGKAFLYSTQKNGNWEVVPAPDPTATGGWMVENTQYTGLTAIATFALLASGEDPQDPRIRAAVDFLKKHETHGIYALGLRCQVWNMIPQDESLKQVMLRDRDLLLQGMSAKEPSIGFYGYDVKDPGSNCDHSSSQFAVLGMWALQQAGVEVPTKYWQIVDSGWRREQLADASWAYHFPVAAEDASTNAGTVSMTSAGVATLFITQDYTAMAARCQGNINDPSIDKGMAWIGDHLKDLPEGRRYYTLFGVSRVGLASGFKYIGNVDWFKFGAQLIVDDQAPDGSWQMGGENPGNIPNTSFAMLFLSRGRAPVMMNKLNYDVEVSRNKTAPAPWNQRPRDVANLTRMIGRQLESQFNWQIVSLHQSAEDLHDAPILYMSGNQAPKLSPEDQAKLKTYLEDGGLLLGHADCGSVAFNGGFRKLAETMFPGSALTPLPLDHPIYVSENFPRKLWKSKPQLDALTNGSRILMLLIPEGDPAKAWQTQSFPNIKSDPFGQMMIDILLYAGDQQNLRKRGETYLVSRNASVHADKTLKIARLKYTGNWDPEPGGWRRLASAMHNDRHIDLDLHVVDPATQPLDQSYNAAHLTLAGAIALTDPARKAIRDYVNAGGTLVLDVAGGSGLDRTSAELELNKIFPDAPRPLPKLAGNSPVYSAGGPIGKVDYRRFARLLLGNLHTPQLCGLTLGNRVAVIYSPDDISTGLVGESVGGIVGYAPQSATPLMENILTYAGKH
jgi:hypothetical protein